MLRLNPGGGIQPHLHGGPLLGEQDRQQGAGRDQEPLPERVLVPVVRLPHHLVHTHVVAYRQRRGDEDQLHHRVVPVPPQLHVSADDSKDST